MCVGLTARIKKGLAEILCVSSRVIIDRVMSEIMASLIRLRPHHLLCTQGYEGRGYSKEFVANMTAITARLRGEDKTSVQLVFSTDDICDACPQKLAEDLCARNDKMKLLDGKVCDYFALGEKQYIYQELVSEIKAKMTAAMMDDICGDCSWYSESACKDIIVCS